MVADAVEASAGKGGPPLLSQAGAAMAKAAKGVPGAVPERGRQRNRERATSRGHSSVVDSRSRTPPAHDTERNERPDPLGR
eukprot:15318804-Alexandrium_andersonii.AAC.1